MKVKVCVILKHFWDILFFIFNNSFASKWLINHWKLLINSFKIQILRDLGDVTLFKGPDHLQKHLFLKNHISYAMPKKVSKT